MRAALRTALRAGALLLLLLATDPLPTDARGVSVNLAASWPSSPLFPLLETSEYLAEENPAFFWQFVERLKSQTVAIAAADSDVDALAELAVQEALHIAPASKNILELMLATRTYSVKVEMYRQLGLDSGVRVCSADTDTWAVLYSQAHCVESVACSASELDAALHATTTSSNDTCVATGVNDVAMSAIDHTFPQSAPTRAAKTAILYGAVGTRAFYAFHDVLAEAATQHRVQYIVRPFALNATLETRLQGYGVALDIKNMEYKTIDDSQTGAELADAGDDLDDDLDDDDSDVDGLLFQTLVARHSVLADALKQFRDSLAHQDAQSDAQQVKAWHLKDVGLVAARDVLAAARPLQKLQALSQDFPKHAARLAFARTPVTDSFRDEAVRRRAEAAQADLLDKFFVNGIAVDPTQRSFNIFDFMATLKAEWSVAKQLAALPLSASELADMLAHVRESHSAEQVVRIHVRGAVDGAAPFYLNDIASDPKTLQWPRDVDQLRRPAWNIVFVRRNMYESVVVFDPIASAGRLALQQIAFMRMRGAPIQWALLVSSKELLAAPSRDVRDALVAEWKRFALSDRASAWHFAKLLFLARAKDDELAGADDVGGGARGLGRVVASFIEGVADESVSDVSVKHLVTCYVDGAFGMKSRATLEAEALAVLRNDTFDDLVMSMTEFIQAKHLPLESSLFNGVLREHVDLQRDLMAHLGRDQALYQALARSDSLPDDSDDLIEELLASQETYPSYFPIFDAASSRSDDASGPATTSLLAHDVDASIETLLEQHVDYLHAPQSLLLPKKQTLLVCADLSDAVHAAHVFHGVKAVLEDSDRALRIGIVPRNRGADADGGDGEANAMRQLVTAIVAAVGTSDVEAHLRFVLDTLSCVVRGKSVDATRSKLRGILERLEHDGALPDPAVRTVLKRIVSADDASDGDSDSALSDAKRDGLERLSNALQGSSHGAAATGAHAARLYINGYPIELPASSITDDDMAALTRFDAKYRSYAVARAFVSKTPKRSVADANAVSLLVVKACDLVDRYTRMERTAGLDDLDASELVVRLPGDAALQVSAYLDPLSEATQMISSLLLMLHRQLNASVDIVLLPVADYAELPLQRFYRYLFDTTASLATPSVEFRKLPIKPILTMKLETPEAWNVQVHRTLEDLDNLRVDTASASDVRATKSASFRLESLLVYGQCRDKTFDMYTPPHGLQLVLQRDVGAMRLHRDTLVMRNLGYFQLQATPGVWSLHLARGRATDLFEIIDTASDSAQAATPVLVADFGSHVTQLVVRKRPGREHDELLDPEALKSAASQGNIEPIAADAGLLGSYLGSMVSSLLGKTKSASKSSKPTEPADSATAVAESPVNRGRTGETIHVFSLASGHLYERFLKIMMSSVLKRTANPVTFWLLENFLSPAFKQSIPALREAFGMDIRLVTYKWPNWLRQQTQKQRIIWGYKILFLDVLFPLGVQKIIYVDADQVVRADLKELWDMDLDGAPYGYTPFCDARNVGFQFWRQGYWKDHLRGRPYHISALYVVDLALFRQMAAGDALRATYDQLSADPNSLANLDQDLPNYTQHQIRIFSLPREWLWCDSWCSDESKAQAKTIDLCNNPKHKEPKLDMAKRVISGELFPESWVELDQEIKDAEAAFAARAPASIQ